MSNVRNTPYLQGERSGPHSYLLYGKLSKKSLDLFTTVCYIRFLATNPDEPSPAASRMRSCVVGTLILTGVLPRNPFLTDIKKKEEVLDSTVKRFTQTFFVIAGVAVVPLKFTNNYIINKL